jgi:predicted AlkP superfamily phosphohydrolase/phosphomutase
MRTSLPGGLVQNLWGLLPAAAHDWLVPLLSARTRHWPSTRHFALPSDLFGLIRVNLEGREAQGIVPPGAAYGAILDEVTEAWSSIRDLDRDRPIVRAVERVDDHVGPDHAARRWLPDLTLLWSSVQASEISGLRLPGADPLRWTPGGRLPSGRSGNHRGQGWLVAAGAGILADRALDAEHELMDLPPTLFDWLGVQPPDGFEGRAIPALVGGEG